jgi:hypothetical protein
MVYKKNNWAVVSSTANDGSSTCLVRAEFTDGHSFSVVLPVGNYWTIVFTKHGGYVPNKRYELTIMVDETNITTTKVRTAFNGEARVPVPAVLSH